MNIENIKEFLLNNYIWLIVVIVLIIITIIGFIADKAKQKKKIEADANQNVSNDNNGQIQGETNQALNGSLQNPQMNMNVNSVNPIGTPTAVDVLTQLPNSGFSQNNVPPINSTIPVQNVNSFSNQTIQPSINQVPLGEPAINNLNVNNNPAFSQQSVSVMPKIEPMQANVATNNVGQSNALGGGGTFFPMGTNNSNVQSQPTPTNINQGIQQPTVNNPSTNNMGVNQFNNINNNPM